MPKRLVSKPPGRVKQAQADRPPKKTTTVNLEWDVVDWMDENLPRTTTVSEFVNEALRAYIAKKRR